jgi:GT2 family glycosyltransferase
MLNDVVEAPKAAADARPELPPASLIVCSRNRPQLLVDTVHSILTAEAMPTELIVVDQSDQPNPALEQLPSSAGCQIRYLWTRTVGLSRANNLGIAAARYDLLVFTHDDVFVSADWLEAITRALLAAGSRSIVTGRVRPDVAGTSGRFVPATKDDPAPAIYSGRLAVDVLYPLNMALHRSAIADVGGFDERLGPGTRFPGAEDSDLGFRLLEAGYRICYVPQAVVYHRAWRTTREYLPLRWGYGYARGAFYAKHWNRRDSYATGRLIADMRNHLVSLPQRLWRERLRAYGDLALLAGMLSGAATWLMSYGTTRRPR